MVMRVDQDRKDNSTFPSVGPGFTETCHIDVSVKGILPENFHTYPGQP